MFDLLLDSFVRIELERELNWFLLTLLIASFLHCFSPSVFQINRPIELEKVKVKKSFSLIPLFLSHPIFPFYSSSFFPTSCLFLPCFPIQFFSLVFIHLRHSPYLCRSIAPIDPFKLVTHLRPFRLFERKSSNRTKRRRTCYFFSVFFLMENVNNNHYSTKTNNTNRIISMFAVLHDNSCPCRLLSSFFFAIGVRAF